MQVVLVTLYTYTCYDIDVTIYITCENHPPSPPQLAGLILQCIAVCKDKDKAKMKVDKTQNYHISKCNNLF